jgi:hypothetical protein
MSQWFAQAFDYNHCFHVNIQNQSWSRKLVWLLDLYFVCQNKASPKIEPLVIITFQVQWAITLWYIYIFLKMVNVKV